MLTERITDPVAHFRYLIDNVFGKEEMIILFNTEFQAEMDKTRSAWVEWKRAFDRRVRMRAVEVDKVATEALNKAGLLDQIPLAGDGSPVLICVNTDLNMFTLDSYAKMHKIDDAWTADTIKAFVCDTVAAAKASSSCGAPRNSKSNAPAANANVAVNAGNAGNAGNAENAPAAKKASSKKK